MKTVKVTFSDGDYIITSINGTEEEIRNYYRVGKTNVHGREECTGWKEYKRQITGVEFLNS